MATLTIADLDNGKRDLQTVDEVANSRAATATTRFGQQTTTLYEAIRRINAQGDEILSNLGFRIPVPYAPGLNVTDSRFTVTGPDGKVYAPLSAPFTTGAWDPSQWYVLQNDLNDHKLLVFDTLVAAEAAAAVLPDGQIVKAPDLNGRQTIYSVGAGVLKFEHFGSTAFNYIDAGAVGDGIADDLAAVLKMMQYSGSVDWGDKTYRCSAPIAVSSRGTWISSGAKIVYDGAPGQNIAFNVTVDAPGLTISGSISFDGSNKCAKTLYIGNNSDSLPDFVAPRIHCANARKTGTDFGAALMIEGNFARVDISGSLVENVSMADGAKATPGVCGTIIKASSAARYPRLVYLGTSTAKEVYADGYDYAGDQDGFRIFGPDGAASAHPHRMMVFADKITAINCMGRGIKTQCDYAEINGVYIERNIASPIAPWGIDVDVQTGGGFVKNVIAVYRENVPVSTVLINSTIAGYKDLPSVQVDGVQITNLTGTSLREILLIGSRETTKPPQVFASGFRCIGLLDAFVRSSPLTGTNGLNVVMDNMIGSPSLGAFVTDASSSTGRVFGRGVVNLGAATVPFWRRSSTGQIWVTSAFDCLGWLSDRRVALATDNFAPQRVGALAPLGETACGTIRPFSKQLANDEVWQLPPFGWNNAGVYIIHAGAANNDFAFLCAGAAAITNVFLGSSFVTGGTSEPATGSYRVWTSSAGIFIANRSGSARMFTILAIG